MTTKAKPRGITVTTEEFDQEIRLPIVLKGAQATTVIGENQKVVATVTQDGDTAALDGPRAFVKWLERDPETRVDFWLEVGRESLTLTSVYASDVLLIADAIRAAVREAERRGLIQVSTERERIATTAIRRNGKCRTIRR